MCGITGIISKKTIDTGIIEKMTDTIVSRGPDGFGYHYGEGFVFGHRRLSIVDLSEAGHQPMHYLDRYIITYNGEIYNHIEIRQELKQKGYHFSSHSDTEVLMAAFDFWGVECLQRFNGMWAFVIYDQRTNRFFMSRDRFGKKPFYYYKNDEVFLFGSEIKTLLKHPALTVQANIPFLDNYLKYGCKEFIKETAFEEVYRFDFSSYFIGTADELLKRFECKKFWELKPNTEYKPFDPIQAKDYAKKYYNLLEDAVRIRLRADVKIGSALSGGLDSSSIVYLVNKLLKEQDKEGLQEVFSCVYKSPGTEECDESTYINIMAHTLGVHSNQIEPFESEIPNEHAKMIYALENPPENSLMSSWYTFKLVSQTDVKVTLDGQGADEQLSGYLPYLMNYISSLSFKDLFTESYQCLSIPGARKFVLIGMMMGIFRMLLGEVSLRYILKKVLKKNFDPNLNQQLANDTMSNLITLIHYADHTSMAYSIESRMPFMDYRLVEFLASVPASYKMHNGWTKYLARLAFDKKLPDEINWRRDKMGWPIPEKQWFEGNLHNWFTSILQTGSIRFALRHPHVTSEGKLLALKVKLANIAQWEKIFIGRNSTP